MALSPNSLLNIQRLADDEDFAELIKMLRLDYFELWCKERDPAMRERLHQKQEALDDIVVRMRAAADEIAFAKQRNN
jgi:hypothetical protein